MLDLPVPARPAGVLPNAYHEALYWRITDTRGRVILIQFLALLSFIVFGGVFLGLAMSVGKLPTVGSFSIGLGELGAAVGGTILTLVFHELIHGVAMQLFGAKPEYGVLWKSMMLYTTTPGYAYERNQYLIILLAPFVVISILASVAMWWLQGTMWLPLLVLCASLNASGAIGDMWMSIVAWRYAPNAYLMDDRDGMRVFLPTP